MTRLDEAQTVLHTYNQRLWIDLRPHLSSFRCRARRSSTRGVCGRGTQEVCAVCAARPRPRPGYQVRAIAGRPYCAVRIPVRSCAVSTLVTCCGVVRKAAVPVV